MKMDIDVYNDALHREQVIELWHLVFGYEAGHNAPDRVIDMKLQHADELFFVALKEKKVIGTMMAGYDGHRGWIYSVAVHPDERKQNIGSEMLLFTQRRLERLGCMKINLQILGDNKAVKDFYEANGFSVEDRVSMGKKLY